MPNQPEAVAPRVRLYRFREFAAFNVDVDGVATFYVSAALARQLAEELRRIADDIDAVPFHKSEGGPVDCYGGA